MLTNQHSFYVHFDKHYKICLFSYQKATISANDDDAIDSLSQILLYESTRYSFESHFL